MKNIVTMKNPMRKTQKMAILFLALFLFFALTMTVFLSLLNKNDYNGQLVQFDGKVEFVKEIDGANLLKLQGNEELFNIVQVVDVVNWQSLQNKQISIWVPVSQLGNAERFVQGVAVDGVVVVDAQLHNAQIRDENQKMLVVSAVFAAVLATGLCAVVIWKINTNATKEFPLAQKYAEYYEQRQPPAKERKIVAIVGLVMTSVIAVLGIALFVINCIKEQSDDFNLAFCGALLGVMAVEIVAVLLLSRWAKKKEIAFYAENFPFDFTDISHIRMRRELKAQISKELLEEQQKHPFDFGDGGNGFVVQFGETGVKLFVPTFDEHAPNPFEEHEPAAELTYGQLALEAVPIFCKFRPLVVVIKSRLEVALPQNCTNDLHFVLDKNLLEVLHRFDVPVENLEYILQNKQQLMLTRKFNK